MSDQKKTAFIEFPSGIIQQEIWDLEEQLNQIEGVTTDLQEPKDPLATTLLILNVITSSIGVVAALPGGIKATHEVAKLLHAFFHPVKQEKVKAEHKVVITKKGKKIELYNLSVEEIEKLLKE